MKEIKAIYLRGIQGSGKSYWVENFIKQNQKYKRVNRDLIRHQLSAYTYNDENEKLVTVIENNTIDVIIENGYNVIIDSMNLHKHRLDSRIKILKDKWLAKDVVIVSEVKNFPITLEEAIIRDSLRDFKIGEAVIRKTWEKYKNELIEMLEENNKTKIKYNSELQDICILDLDGTIALRNQRNPYDYSKVLEDSVNENVKLVVNALSKTSMQEGKENIKVFVFSGRDDVCMDDSIKWLQQNNIIFHKIVMRKTGDKRKDTLVKKEMWQEHIKDKFNVVAVFDDRPSVIKGWRELGLFVFDCGHGVDF